VIRSRGELSPEQAAAAAMVAKARARGLELTGPNGLLKVFTKNVLETALNEEMTEHLGHPKHQAEPGREATNVRNGSQSKTVISDAAGEVVIEVPRDREGTFAPQIVKKRQRVEVGPATHPSAEDSGQSVGTSAPIVLPSGSGSQPRRRAVNGQSCGVIDSTRAARRRIEQGWGSQRWAWPAWLHHPRASARCPSRSRFTSAPQSGLAASSRTNAAYTS
jgi:hypothetical protein